MTAAIPVLDELRRQAPVRPIELPTGRGWLVTRYADIRQVLADPRRKRPQGATGQ